MARLAHIFRHPIKGIGSESLHNAEMSPDGALLGDRAWALLTAAARDTDDWQPRRNFVQVASGPGLASVRARTAGERIRLSRPDMPDLSVSPQEGGVALSDWLGGLWPEDRPPPGRLVRAFGHGMTDMAEPYVSIGNLSSLRTVSQRAGQSLDMRRFRINLWIDGLAPWKEFDLIDARIRIGSCSLTGAERIGRCRAPEANPETGRRDVITNAVLEDGWGHTNFGVYARVDAPGSVTLGDPVVLPWS